MAADIVYAGYGVWNSTFDVTPKVASLYSGGVRHFEADNSLYGDPAPGDRKYLYIVWKSGGTSVFSGVVGEGDKKGINLP